ncbi:MAG: hypothetical protein JST93_26685 [Acidobacteria bacterium]|nr:hypothetical protein [Acidobacteriota bacterium]
MTTRWMLSAGLLVGALAMAPVTGWAQTATVEGALSAFDVVNDSGRDVYGFEIEIEGAVPGDLYYTMNGQRYGAAVVTPYATGVRVRWSSRYDSASGQYTAKTPQHVPGTPFSWNDCYTAGSRYATSGCEHFGQSMRATAPGKITKVSGYWLVDDPASHGSLIQLHPPAAIPFAAWSIAPPVTISTPPVVVAEVEAPEPPEAPEKYGDAQWVKIYKTQLNRPVTADDLSSTNPAVVPEDPSQLEVSWDILQADPPAGGNGKRNRTRRQNQGSIQADTRTVIRRYELYKYTGAYDALDHKVACADGTCTAPSAGELGDALSAQNTAVNVVADSVTVTRTGNGSVGGASGKISCGNACTTFAPNGTAVSLTANPGGAVFTGWSGACSGTSLSCSLNVTGQVKVGAAFKNQYTLSVGRSNPGTITASPTGNDRLLDCGGNCSAKFTDGTAVTLTAIPPAGKTFSNWAGACSGTSATCTVVITRDTSVQAVFNK